MEIKGNINLDKESYKANGEVIEFDWPIFKTTFPKQRSGFYTKKLVDKCSSVVILSSNLREVSFKPYYHLAAYAGLWYPHCKQELRLEVLMKAIYYVCILDDHTECEWGDGGRKYDTSKTIWTHFSDIFDKLLGKNVSMLDWEPYNLALFALYDTMFATYNSVQQERCAKYHKDYARGNIVESEWYELKDFESVEQVLEVRLMTVGIYPIFQMIEYSENIYITEEEWNDKLLLELLDCGVKLVLLINDLYSFRKELNECNGNLRKCRNLIALYVNFENNTFQEAVDRLFHMIIESEKRIWDLEKEYFATHEVSENMKTFINAYNYLLGGNWVAHCGLDRYTDKDPETEAKVIKGHFSYDSNENIVEDCDPAESLTQYFKLK